MWRPLRKYDLLQAERDQPFGLEGPGSFWLGSTAGWKRQRSGEKCGSGTWSYSTWRSLRCETRGCSGGLSDVTKQGNIWEDFGDLAVKRDWTRRQWVYGCHWTRVPGEFGAQGVLINICLEKRRCTKRKQWILNSLKENAKRVVVRKRTCQQILEFPVQRNTLEDQISNCRAYKMY